MPADRYEMEARSAYIHVPFCRHRCGYCNFTLVSGRDAWIERYLLNLKRELALLKKPRQLDTLYMGGGTPTHLSSNQLDRLLEIVDEWLPRGPTSEFTMEANPSDLKDHRKLDVIRQHGVNRMSLGVQSLQPRKLDLLERDHTPREVHDVMNAIRPWLRSISLDLIFGTPDETLDEWKSDIFEVSLLPIDHVSTYGLTIEKGTSFWKRKHENSLVELDEDTSASCYEYAIDRLSELGFEHYEVSSFSRPAHRCQHNEVYWSGKPFFGFGPGAASYTGTRRDMNHRSTSQYFKLMETGGPPVFESETLNKHRRAKERLVIGLRRMEGWNLAHFEDECGFSVHGLVGPKLKELIRLGYLIETDSTLKLSRAGLMISDSLWTKILAD